MFINQYFFPVDLSKESDVGKNEVVKKTEYNELVKKANANKTTDTSNLGKETDYDTKISKIFLKSNKYITTQKFNQLIAENFAARLKEASLATLADIDDFVEKPF